MTLSFTNETVTRACVWWHDVKIDLINHEIFWLQGEQIDDSRINNNRKIAELESQRQHLESKRSDIKKELADAGY
jgi:hypothetical protein